MTKRAKPIKSEPAEPLVAVPVAVGDPATAAMVRLYALAADPEAHDDFVAARAALPVSA